MRTKVVAGNWKMHKTAQEAKELIGALSTVTIPEDKEVILGVPYVFLAAAYSQTADSAIGIAAQNCHQENSGAFTGEISCGMLASLGIDYVILGHSERRAQFKEDHALLAAKVDQTLAHQLKPIFCCGEPLEIREAGTHVAYVAKQLEESLFHLEGTAMDKVIIAYEPIWAIGTGVTASPQQAQDMHASIRKMLAGKYGNEVAQAMRILYGGSVKPANATELFSQEDVDGGLVGGASLKPDDFAAIIQA